jgi:hypothetical protein
VARLKIWKGDAKEVKELSLEYIYDNYWKNIMNYNKEEYELNRMSYVSFVYQQVVNIRLVYLIYGNNTYICYI